MSRIRLEPLDAADHPGREVYTGWDHGPQTYFATVIDGPEEDLVLDLGNDYGEITDPAAVLDALRPYAMIPDDLHDTLDRDQAEDTIAGLSQEAGNLARQALRGDTTALAALIGRTRDDEDDELDEDHDLSCGLGY